MVIHRERESQRNGVGSKNCVGRVKSMVVKKKTRDRVFINW